jgi:replicative DNA helicase
MSLAPVLPVEPGRSTDRVLPHDLLAEQSTLGAMLLSQEAVADYQKHDIRKHHCR